MKRLLMTSACVMVLGSLAGCGDVGKEVEKAGAAAKDKAGKAAETAKEKAGEAAKDLTVGGVNLGTEFTALVEKLKTTLTEIKDSDTAEKAKGELEQADTQLEGLLEKAEKLPEAARPALKEIVQKGLAALKPLIDKVLAIDGVGEKLKPLLDGLVAKLKTAAGEK
jgi:hypothetical protein